MAAPWYTVTGSPVTGSPGASAVIRSEFANIASSFALMPALTAGTAIVVNAGGTALANTVGTLALAGNFATTGAFAITLTAISAVTLTLPATSQTLATLAGVETLTNKTISAANNTITNISIGSISGFGTGVSTFLTTPSSANLAAALTDGTGTGAAVFASSPSITSPSLITPVLGTPTSGTLANCTGLPVSTGISGFGTGVATALAISIGSSGAAVTNGGALGTPSSGTLTNATGLPLTTGITGVLGPTNGGKPANRYTNFTNASTFSTLSVTTVMGGFGSSWALTPAKTGNVRVRIIGYLSNNNAFSTVFSVNYGTGTAPTQGAATTGTAGATTTNQLTPTGTVPGIAPFAYEFEVTSLTLSTAYWFDISMRTTTGGTAAITPISVIIEEF